MKSITPMQEARIKKLLISRIMRLREAGNEPLPDDEEEDAVPSTDPAAAPQKPVAPAPQKAAAPKPKVAPTAPAPEPTAEPTAEPAEKPVPAKYTPKVATTPDPGAETPSEPMDAPVEPDIDVDKADGNNEKIRRAKVKLFFDKLVANPTLMSYLNFNNPLEQAEAIEKFAEMVQVPASQLIPLLTQLRTMSQDTAPKPQAAESIQRRRLREEDMNSNQYQTASLSELASMIRRDWKNVYFGAKPYLDALGTLDSIGDNYGMDSGRSIVAYFLANATTWRGPVAKAIKLELNRRLKQK
jgi:hypothetical protein